MDMKKLEASIVIPMYNAEATIIETLRALDMQTNKNFEVIVVDDGSKDNSFNTVKKYKAEFPLKIFKQKNKGPASARNNGAKKARAEILIFIDSDCIPHKTFVEKILKPFLDRKVIGVHGEYETKNKNSLIARYFGYESYYRHEKMKKAKSIDHMATYACAYRKKDFGKGFSEKFKKANMEDIELSYRLAKEGKKLVFSPSVIVKHPHPASLIKFLKQQYSRGYWRVLGYGKHPEKVLKDSYLGYDILIQGCISILFLFSFILSLFAPLFFFSFKAFLFSLFFLLVLYILNIPFGLYCFRYEKKMIFLAPLIASCRSIIGTIGFLVGIIKFKVFSKKV